MTEIIVTQQPRATIVVSESGTSVGVSPVPVDAISYHHIQGASASVWAIHHGLGFYPNVTTMDSAGSTVQGELEHLSKHLLRVTFSAPISGNAFLS